MIDHRVEFELLIDAAHTLHGMIQANLNEVERLIEENRRLRSEIRTRITRRQGMLV
jgi:hypothetical protein